MVSWRGLNRAWHTGAFRKCLLTDWLTEAGQTVFKQACLVPNAWCCAHTSHCKSPTQYNSLKIDVMPLRGQKQILGLHDVTQHSGLGSTCQKWFQLGCICWAKEILRALQRWKPGPQDPCDWKEKVSGPLESSVSEAGAVWCVVQWPGLSVAIHRNGWFTAHVGKPEPDTPATLLKPFLSACLLRLWPTVHIPMSFRICCQRKSEDNGFGHVILIRPTCKWVVFIFKRTRASLG